MIARVGRSEDAVLLRKRLLRARSELASLQQREGILTGIDNKHCKRGSMNYRKRGNMHPEDL
jgi:hypothetical protein